MSISLDCVYRITWPREQYCSQEHVLFTTPPKLSVIFYVFGSARSALLLGLVMERVFGVTVVSSFSGFILRPWKRWWSAVLWHLTLCLATHLTIACSGCDCGLDAKRRAALWSKCCRSNGIGNRLAWISSESVGDIFMAPVITRAAVLWACIIFLVTPCDPLSRVLESPLINGLIQTLAVMHQWTWKIMSISNDPGAKDEHDGASL